MIKTTTLRLPSETLIKIKAIAVETGKSQNNVMNELINKGLKATEKGKIKAKIINDKLPKLEGKAENIEDLAGFVELDYKTNAVNLKDNIHMD